jgi:hypothetical protein
MMEGGYCEVVLHGEVALLEKWWIFGKGLLEGAVDLWEKSEDIVRWSIVDCCGSGEESCWRS